MNVGEIKQALSIAFKHFNDELFQGSVEECTFVFLHDHPTARGMFDPRTSSFPCRTRDSIFIDRNYLLSEPREALGTVVHEMVHAWQYHLGQFKCVTGYHNEEWADKMESIGLMPSTTGEPGGERTGPTVTHYIIPGGRFELAYSSFENRWLELIRNFA